MCVSEFQSTQQARRELQCARMRNQERNRPSKLPKVLHQAAANRVRLSRLGGVIAQVLAGGDALRNGAVELAVGELHGHSHRVLDGVRIGRPMADDAYTLNTQQRRAAVLGIVEALLEIGEGLAREQKSDLAADGRLQRLLEQEAHRLDHAFGDFQRDVADEAVAHQHIGLAVVQIAPFDVAHEVHGQLFDQLVRFAREFVALALFFADGEQPDTRIIGAGKSAGENSAEVHVAHDGELLQILRLGIDVRTDVNKNGGGALGGGKNGGKRGTVHAGDGAQNHLCGGHRRARVAGGYETGGLAVAHQAKSDTQRRVTFGAHRLRRLLMHADNFACIDDADCQLAPETVQVKFATDDLFFPHQHDFHVVVPCREDRPFYFGFGGAVSAHGVKSDDGRHVCLSVAVLAGSRAYDRRKEGFPASGLAGALFDLDDLAALIITAFWAGTMRQLALVAVGALGQRLGCQMIVGAALGRARLGVTSFRIRHGNLATWIARHAPANGTLALQLLLDFVQRLPAGIAEMLLTMAFFDVAVAPAKRTQPFAIFAAQRPYWRGQQNLLAQGVFQQQTFALIIADLSFCFGDRDLVGAAVHAQRPVDQIERPVHIMADRLQAASTTVLQLRLDLAHQPDVLDILMVPAVLHDQFRAPSAAKRAHLQEVNPKLDGAGLKSLVELQVAEFQFPNPNQHSSTGLSPKQENARNSSSFR